MTVVIRRKLRRNEKKEVIKSYIDEAQFLLERALRLGFTLDEILERMTPGQKDLVEKMIITNECKTALQYSKVRGITNTRVGQIIYKVYLVLDKFIFVNFLYDFGRKYLKPLYQESNYGNWRGEFISTRQHINVGEQIRDIRNDIFLLPDHEIEKLASISNHIHLSLKE